MPASPAALLAGFPPTHFMPSRSSEPSSAARGRRAGIAWANEPGGRGWTASLGGSSAPSARPRRVVSASASRRSSGGMAAVTSAAVR